ncbi:pectinesterase inhibitor 7-like [Impatiens glandulifera]|uniref:pectinesterase inhibitor 7-like n=1 Tax=Impatiens glandulifera TaxID=253017 RepID=UPI001FB0ADFB|nr:pectinesterase inhibitor 7-like [Impatiens glandulifera]
MRRMSKLFPGFSLGFLIIILMNFILPSSSIALISSATGNDSRSSTTHNVTSSKNKKSDDFIRSSCGETLYPDLCYTSFAGYAYTVQKDPALLARIAIGLSLFKARHLASNFSHAANDYASYSFSYDNNDHNKHNALIISALHDCVSVLGDAMDQIRGSLKQMRSLNMGGMSGESLRFGLSDVQTWMSAALTNEDTCAEGLEEVEISIRNGGGIINNNLEALCYAATKVKHVTSNALALVNVYVNKISSPSSSHAAAP